MDSSLHPICGETGDIPCSHPHPHHVWGFLGEPMLQTKAFWFCVSTYRCLSHCVYPSLCVFCLLWDVSSSCTSLQSLCCPKSWLTCVRSYKRLGSMKPCTPDTTEFQIFLFSKAFGHSCHWAGAVSWAGEENPEFSFSQLQGLFFFSD